MEKMMANSRKAVALFDELRVVGGRIVWCVLKGTVPDPEDIVVLRGSTEALIEIAENP